MTQNAGISSVSGFTGVTLSSLENFLLVFTQTIWTIAFLLIGAWLAVAFAPGIGLLIAVLLNSFISRMFNLMVMEQEASLVCHNYANLVKCP